jgi:hypothetical protein
VNDDRFMQSLRRDPDPAQARSLWARLRAQSPAVADDEAPRFAWQPAFAGLAAAALVVALFVFPSARATAQAFLDLFRVRNFVAVNVDPDRFKALDSKLDLKTLVGDRVQTLQEPGAPRPFISTGAAGAASGLFVKTPGWLPGGMTRADTVWVAGEGRMRITADTQRLRQVLDALDLRDVQIPAGLDGRTVDVHAWPAVHQRFTSDRRRAMLIQAKSPEVSLPAGVDLARLGEIALRVLGMSASEARSMADRTDWRTTLLVPVPVTSGSFQEVDVNGARGLMVRFEEPAKGDQPARRGAMVLWNQGDDVFALTGNLDSQDLVQMAGSIR